MDGTTRRDITNLMSRLAEGDRDAFDPMFDVLWPFLRAFATRMCGEDGDDAAQQALLRVFARAPEYDPGRDAVTWLVAITANECRTLRNQRQRRREDPLESAVGARCPEPSEDRANLEAAAVELLGQLPPDDLAAIRAAWFGDPRPDVGPATFRKRVQRATGRLRELWRLRHDHP